MKIPFPYLRPIVAGVTVVMLGAAGVWAYAGSGVENDAVAVNEAKISLIHAVSIAEHHLQGRASRAQYERTPNGPSYEVEVVQGSKVFDVRVDADKGTILSSALDDPDHGHGEKD